MAEGPDPAVADLEQEVTCGICHDHYQEPKLLPCCHYYCKQCILTLSGRYRPNEPFPCPDCREPTLLPDTNLDKLPTAFFINRIKEIHSRMEKAQGKLEATCEACSNGKIVAFCRQCVNFICEKCVHSHQRMKKTFAGHKISTLGELTQGGLKEVIIENSPPPKCDDHDEPKKKVCYNCKKLICRDCADSDEHRDHESEFVKKAASATRKNLTEHLNPLKSLVPTLAAAVKKVRETKENIGAEKVLVEKDVNAKFQDLHDILEGYRALVLKEYSVLSSTKEERLHVEEKSLELSLGTVQSLIDFADRTLDNASDEELVLMQEQVVSRIDAEVAKREKEAAGVHPRENACFGVNVFAAEDLRKLCESNVVIYPAVRGDGVKMAEVDSCAQFSIFSGSKENRPQAVLKSLVDGSSQQLQVVPIEGGLYDVKFTPEKRGRHHILVSIKDQHVPGSPFSVPVKMHPSKLDKPITKMEGIYPWGGTFNSSGELIVTDDDSKGVVVLNKKGEKIRSISRSKYGFNSVCGVAVDKDDNIYVSDSSNHCVYKFNKKGDLLNKFEKNESHYDSKTFNFPLGIAVAGNRVLVCDKENSRILVLTTELRPVKAIGGMYIKNPWDIAVDDEQIYIAESGKDIKVFAMDGQFVCCFGEERLDSARGVCVDGESDGFVYVSNWTNHCVCIFTKGGQFIKSVGSGHIIRPYGVFTDSDGFLYVCNNSAITVF